MLVAISSSALASESLNIGKLQGGVLLGQWEHEFLWCDAWFAFPEADGGISILDESLGIDWRIPTEHVNLSGKDTKHEVLKDFDSPFEY